MQLQRITISIPDYLYKQLISLVPPRGTSDFINKALEERILNLKINKKQDPIADFFTLAKKYPIKKTKKQILQAIKKGRL